MGIREQRERDTRIARDAVPAVIEALRQGNESLSIATDIAEKHDLDPRKAYKWVEFIEERFEARRHRLARRSAGLMWLGIVLVLAGGGSLVARYYAVGVPAWAGIMVLAVGIPLAVTGILRGLSVRRRVTLDPAELELG